MDCNIALVNPSPQIDTGAVGVSPMVTRVSMFGMCEISREFKLKKGFKKNLRILVDDSKWSNLEDM